MVCGEGLVGCEHPKVHPGFIGRPYKYCYVVGWVESVNRGHFANAVTKVDMETGETKAWRGDEFQHPAGIFNIIHSDKRICIWISRLNENNQHPKRRFLRTNYFLRFFIVITQSSLTIALKKNLLAKKPSYLWQVRLFSARMERKQGH